jgi:glycosyltransferase involved in cell wall biosynthesis
MTLPKYGYDVGFVCLVPDMFPEAYQSKSSPIYALPMKHKADFSPYKKIREIIKTEQYDIVHSHMPRTVTISRLASLTAKVPMVHHIHSPTLYESPNIITNLMSGFLERISLIGADRIIPCSEGMGRYARLIGIGKKRITVVLNGIPEIGPDTTKQGPSDVWVFGMVALFRPRKGLEYLLNAMQKLKEKDFKFRLRAIGGFKSVEYQKQINQLVEKLDIADLIDWVGFTKKVPEELRKLDCFILPSTKGEGLPIAILEAMSAGLPVITTNIAGSNEVIRDGVDGYFCNPEDSRTLAISMEKLMSQPDKWIKLSKNAYKRQQEHFSEDSMSSGIARIYDEILEAR